MTRHHTCSGHEQNGASKHHPLQQRILPTILHLQCAPSVVPRSPKHRPAHAERPELCNSVEARPRSTTRKELAPLIASVCLEDAQELVAVEFAAFKDERVNHFLSYRDAENPEHISRAVSSYKHCIQRSNIDDGYDQPAADLLGSQDHKFGVHCFRNAGPETSEKHRIYKIFHPGTKKIIAFAKWIIAKYDQEALAAPLDFGHESEPEVNRAWFALNETLHRFYCGGRQHICEINSLASIMISHEFKGESNARLLNTHVLR